jgi:hypothetical protein
VRSKLANQPPTRVNTDMSSADRMKDPFYVSILFKIESRIASVDREARTRHLVLTDSQIRSILNKVRKSATGRMQEAKR